MTTTEDLSKKAAELILTGEKFFENQQFSEAEEVFRQAITINPDHAVAHNNLGVVTWQKGNTQEATAYFQKALLINPVYQEAVENLKAMVESLAGPPGA